MDATLVGKSPFPAIFALVRRDELSDAVAKAAIRDAQPALTGAN
ncbi:MAG TPA: hypothetical protein VF927_10860 [Solirubrobacteraceae bacterium]